MSLKIGKLYFYLGFSRHHSMKELKVNGFKPDYERMIFIGAKLGFFRIGIAMDFYFSVMTGEKIPVVHVYLGFFGTYMSILRTTKKRDILK